MFNTHDHLLTRIQAAIHLGITADQFDKLKRRAGTQAAACVCKRNLYALGDVDQLKSAVLDLKEARRKRRC